MIGVPFLLFARLGTDCSAGCVLDGVVVVVVVGGGIKMLSSTVPGEGPDGATADDTSSQVSASLSKSITAKMSVARMCVTGLPG